MADFNPVLLTLPDAQIQPSLAVEVCWKYISVGCLGMTSTRITTMRRFFHMDSPYTNSWCKLMDVWVYHPCIVAWGSQSPRPVILQTHDIVIGPESPSDHKTQKYTNSIVGRYANRIPVGSHVLERNEFKSHLTALTNGMFHALLPCSFDIGSFITLTG